MVEESLKIVVASTPSATMRVVLFLGVLSVAAQKTAFDDGGGAKKKEKKCKAFKCYGRKEAVPKTPFFAPIEDGLCPEGVSKSLAPCCADRDACSAVCGASEEACDAAFAKCTKEACEFEDDMDEVDKCAADAAMAVEVPWRGGCVDHAVAQKRACECVPRADAGGRRAAVLKNVYRRYEPPAEGEDGEVAFTAKLEGLLAKAGNPRKFADLVLRLADKKFPKLFRDKRPPPPKKEKKPRPPKAEAKKKAEAKAEPAAEAKADAAPEVFESGEEDVVDLDEDEDEVMDLDAEL